MNKAALLILILITLTTPFAAARSGQITALSVAEGNESIGGIATFYLEIKPGTGAIYIESYPLTKLDTQLSTRMANDEACRRTSTNCNQYDFFYIIDSGSSLIGGPSAGGALTVLTYAVLEDRLLRNDTAMTGAILSGGIIGSVGGVKAKVAAAGRNGFSAAIIPAWTNESFDELEERYDIIVMPIKTVDEAIAYFTQKSMPLITEVAPPQGYTEGMQRVADTLCQHSQILRASLEDDMNASNADSQYNKSMAATAQGKSYSAASLCFSASLASQDLLLQNASNETRKNVLNQIIRDQKSITEALEHSETETLADFELSMVIQERLADTQRTLDAIDHDDPAAYDLAYSYERLETARSWLTMLKKVPSRNAEITDERLERACRRKLTEAQERVNFLNYLYPTYTEQLQAGLQEAFREAHTQHYTLCLLQAAQAKAQANALYTAIFTPAEDIDSVVEEKVLASERNVYKQANKGVFPILGYSYAEYARVLLKSDRYSASLYAEYSLEFSNFDIYFPEEKNSPALDSSIVLIFFTGTCIGIAVGIIAHHIVLKARTHRPKKRRVAAPLPGKKR